MLAHTCYALSNVSLGTVRATRGVSSRSQAHARGFSSLSGNVKFRIGTRIASGSLSTGLNNAVSSLASTSSAVGSLRGYAKIVRKLKKKKSSSRSTDLAEPQDKPLELPNTLAANFGPITPLDLESWIAKGEAEDAARREADLEAKRSQEDEEDEEFDDDEFDEFLDEEDGVNPYAKYKWIEEDNVDEEDADSAWKRDDLMEKKRKRSPPPFAPGRVMLDHEDWTHEKRDCLVEYIKKESGEEESRHFGIVRRPVGVRHWGIVNLATGNEDRVNVYKVIWHWPGADATQLDIKSAKLKIDIVKPLFDRSLKVVDPMKVWKHFVTRSKVKAKPKRRVILPNPATPRASAIVIRPEDQMVHTVRRRDMLPKPHIETKDDEVDYISITEASEVLFAEIKRIISADIPETDPMYHAKKIALKDAELIDMLDEPSRWYLTHRFMYSHGDYFRSNVHRGFACREPEQVLERLRSAEYVKDEIHHRSQFVAKLAGLMEQIKALDTLKDADSPVINSVLTPLKTQKSADGSNTDSVLDPKSITFTFEEMQWIERLKQFALSGEDGEDEEVSYDILKPLGLGSRPHHAFQLLSALSFISPYDNPHVLRYTGPKNFSQSEEASSLDVIEIADGTPHTAATSSLKPKSTSSATRDARKSPNSVENQNKGFGASGYHESRLFESDFEKPRDDVLDAEELTLLEEDEDAKRRFDFGDLPAFAIDSQFPHEIDDAISIRLDEEHREWIWIHVTDVARYVKVGAKAEDEARRRATSLYLPDASFGIFPDPYRQHLSLGGPDLTLPDNQLAGTWSDSPSSNAKITTKTMVAYGSTVPTREGKGLLSLESSNTSTSSLPSSSSSSSKLNRKDFGSRRKQPTLSFGALIDGGGKIEEWRVVNGLISNIEHITYDQLNEILIPQEASDTSAHIRKHIDTETNASRREKFLLANSSWSPSSASSSALSAVAGKEGTQVRDESKWTSGKSLSERLDVNLSPISERAGELKRKYHESLIKLMDFATKRRAYRLERRATLSWMPKPEVRIAIHSTDGSSYISNLGASAHVSMTKDYNKNGQGVVTELMLLAGQVAGHFARANNIPMLYGTQDTRKQEFERSLLDLAHQANLVSSAETGGVAASTPADIMKNINLRRSLKPPTLSTQPTPNVAQGLPLFVSVTSPLRRYLDLVAHYQIKAALRLKKPPFSLKALHDLGVPILARTTEVNSVAKHASRFWVLHCLQQLTVADPFRKFKALVIDSRDLKNGNEATLLLLDFGLETNITAPQLLMRGQTIHVRVDMVNPFYDTLILKEVKTIPPKRRKP